MLTGTGSKGLRPPLFGKLNSFVFLKNGSQTFGL